MWRKVLAVLVIGMGVALLVGLLAMGLDVGDRMNRELASLAANIRVEPLARAAAGEVGAAGAYLDEGELVRLRTIFWRNNILHVVARLRGLPRLGASEVKLVGVWLEKDLAGTDGSVLRTGARRAYKHWEVDGDWPLAPEDCLVGVRLAESRGLAPGDSLDLEDRSARMTLRVAGVVTTGLEEDEAVIADLETVQGFLHLEGKISEADLFALTTPESRLAEKYRKDPRSLTPEEYERWSCTPFPGSIAAQVQQTIRGSSARVVRRVSETQGRVLSRIQSILVILGALGIASSALTVVGVLSSSIRERNREMALHRALGASGSRLFALFLTEAGFLGLLGGLGGGAAGIWLGHVLVKSIFSEPGEVKFALLVLAPLVGMALSLLASSVPVVRALRADPAGALHGRPA